MLTRVYLLYCKLNCTLFTSWANIFIQIKYTIKTIINIITIINANVTITAITIIKANTMINANTLRTVLATINAN